MCVYDCHGTRAPIVIINKEQRIYARPEEGGNNILYIIYLYEQTTVNGYFLLFGSELGSRAYTYKPA